MRRNTARVPKASGSTGDVLVVDDRPGNLFAIERALDGLGARVITASSGEEALRWILHHDAVVILLDVKMPGLSGIETARLVRDRKRTQHVPIIFMTAYDRDEMDVREAYRLGAVDFLFKPIHSDALRAKVGVFVELERRAEEVRRQAAEIRDHERKESSRRLTAQRRRLEAKALRHHLEAERRHSEELQRLNARLEEDDRRKDDFLALLAHELRNPLASLFSGLELLEQEPYGGEDGEVGDQSATVRQVMKRQAAHLVRLVDDLLDVARIARGKIHLSRQPVRIAEVVSHAVAVTERLLAERGHELVMACECGDAVVEGDETRLAQVLFNLLNNAARYTEPGGVIEVRTSRDDGGVVLSVSDNGRGISPELIERIFEPFVQERTGREGLGIGLSMVKELVELHDGRVAATSDGPDRGSEFRVWLPVSDAVAAAAEPTSAGLGAPDDSADEHRALHVALIEDNEDARDLMAQLIGGWGHRVSIAATGRAGIELLTRERPDIAFVDLGLPDMEGYEVARSVCRTLGDARPRMIALSGYSQPDHRKRSAEAGFEHHLAKPAPAPELRRLLSRNPR